MDARSPAGRPASLLPGLWLLAGLLAALTFSLGKLAFVWRGHGPTLSPWGAALIWAALTVLAIRLAALRRQSFGEFLAGGERWLPLAPAAALLLVSASGFRHSEWFFFIDRRAVLWMVLLAIPLGAALKVVERHGWRRWVCPAFLLAAQGWLLLRLGETTGWAPLYRDDHPSFLYRFWLLTESFPRIFFWNPFWNGGYLGTEFISTGTLALGLPGLPLFLALGVERAYTPFLAAVFVGALPWMAWLTVRSLGMGRAAALAAAVLTLGSNRFFFVNLLSYGTTPSLVISFLVLVVWALLYGTVVRGERSPVRWLALAAALQVMVFWPPSVLILAPLAVAVLADAGRLDRRSLLFIGAVALALLAVNGRWILEYVGHPRIVQFISHQGGGAETFSFDKALRALRAGMGQVNPVILVLGLFGLAIPGNLRRRWLVTPVILFGLMISLGTQWKPHLQLNRMNIPLAFLLLVPAAATVERFARRRDLPAAVLRGVVAAGLVMTVVSVGVIYRNRAIEAFRVMPPQTRELASWIRENVPAGGRVFFAGRGVHGYGGGHVAWLQAATGRHMIAGDYYHFDPRVRDYNPVPEEFRGSARGHRGYFGLMGVTHVVTYHQDWKDRLRARKRYELEAVIDKVEVWSTGVPPGLLHTGEGKVTAAVGRLEVELSRPQEEVVLRFNWQPGLSAEPLVELRPVPVAGGVIFIGVRPGATTRFAIRHDS